MLDKSHWAYKYKDIIPEFDRFPQRIKMPLGNFLRINTLKTTREKVLASLNKNGCGYFKDRLLVYQLPKALFTLQGVNEVINGE